MANRSFSWKGAYQDLEKNTLAIRNTYSKAFKSLENLYDEYVRLSKFDGWIKFILGGGSFDC